MNYFSARRAEGLFREYRQLALAYWASLPDDTSRSSTRRKADSGDENVDPLVLREQINLRFPEVNKLAQELGGVGITVESYPAPAVGGPILPINVLLSVIDRNMGHGTIPKVNIVDVINRAIGSAAVVRKRKFWRMIVPLYWPIDILAFAIRLPFVILRKAGIPAWVEENIVSQFVKIAVTVGIILLLAYLGFEEYTGDLIKGLGK